MLSTPEQTQGKERAHGLSASTAAQCSSSTTPASHGLSCRKRIELQWAVPPRGLHGPGRAGNELALGLKSEQEQSHMATGTHWHQCRMSGFPCILLASLFDRSPVCLNRLLGQVIGPQHSGLSGPAGMFPCFKSKVPPILHAHPSWIPTSHHQPPSQWL